MKRVFWMDAVRAVAICLVVFTHAHERAGIQSQTLKSLFYSIDRLGVPLFLMISGALILPKIVNADCFSFYKKRIPQFIVLLIVWSVVTNAVKFYIDGGGLFDSIHIAVISKNGIYPSSYSAATQIWFLYIIIQLYLIAPFLAKLLYNSTNKEICVFLCICIIFNQFKGTVTFLGGDWEALKRMGDDFTGPYIIYFILGYLIVERGVWCGNSKRNLFFNVLLTVLPIIIVVRIDFLSGKINGILHWYSDSLFLILSSTGLFLLLRQMFMKSSSDVLSFISKCSFGIFLTHYAFIYITQSVMSESLVKMDDMQRMFIYFLFSFFAGILLTHFMMKTKLTKYLVS